MKEGSYINLSMRIDGDKAHVVADLSKVSYRDVVGFFLQVFSQSKEVANACIDAVDTVRGSRAVKELGLEDLLRGEETDEEMMRRISQSGRNVWSGREERV